MADLPPGLVLILGALLVPLFRGNLRNAYMLALPIIGFLGLLEISEGNHFAIDLFGYSLTPVRVDRLSLVFGYIFYTAAAICIVYAFHLRDAVQQVAALIYAGCAIGGAFAGDLITLFVYWEGTAIASVFLIWANRTESAYRAGMRYLIIQVGSGVLLLAGAIIHFKTTGSIAFDKMGLTGLGPVLIFAALGIKAAFPLLHNWLQDAYPEATITGTVFLSAFTTKLAIYALARGFPGTELLIWIGAVMVLFPNFYAIVERDLRRVLCYTFNIQLGFMVVGVGVGTELAINGTASHAVASVLYKGLIFMALGAAMYRTGTLYATDLGGLARKMPWTTGLCLIGSASIAAFPLFSGFTTKSLIVSATAYDGHFAVWLTLVLASASVLIHTGIVIPYRAFFGPRTPPISGETPAGMLMAMGVAALLCISIGVYPKALYAILPYAVDYAPYTTTHVVTQLQLLLFSALAFGFLLRARLYPLEPTSTILDFDWTYRRFLPAVLKAAVHIITSIDRSIRTMATHRLERFIAGVFRHHGPEGVLARTWPTGSTVLWVAVLLALYMLFYFV